MPEPRPDESHDQFISRCMEDDEAQQDFPDPDQRLAFCESVWEQNEEDDMGSDSVTSQDVEHRAFTLDEVRIERRQEGESPRIVGHAAVFDQLSENLGGFHERISRGAFSQTIHDDDVRALFNHNPDFVLGRNRAGTLKMEEDEKGLAIEIDPPDTQVARDLMVSLDRGDISQMSFAFTVKPNGQRFEEDRDGRIIRTLTDVRLADVSPVTYPAYTQTDVAVRSLQHWQAEREGNKMVTEDGLLDFPEPESLGRMRAIRDSIVQKERRKASWYEIRAAETADEPTDVMIYDAIGVFGVDARQFIDDLTKLKGRRLRLRINSPGGNIFDGAAIYNALRQHEGGVDVHIEGIAASMASVLACAGTRVLMNQNAFLMIHNASSCVLGDSRAMQHEAALLEKINMTLARTYAIRSGGEVKDFLDYMGEETWLTAEEAKELGLIDEILHETPANIRHHNLAHFRNVPAKLKELRRQQWRQSKRREWVEREKRQLDSRGIATNR